MVALLSSAPHIEDMPILNEQWCDDVSGGYPLLLSYRLKVWIIFNHSLAPYVK